MKHLGPVTLEGRGLRLEPLSFEHHDELVAAAADGKLGPSEWYAISKVQEAEQQAMLAAKLAGASRDQLEQHGRKLRNGDAHGIKVNQLRIPPWPARTVGDHRR